MRTMPRGTFWLVLICAVWCLTGGPAPAAAQLVDGVWPRAGYDPANSRQSPFGATPAAWELASPATGDRSVSWPTVAADGSLLYTDSNFFRFEIPDGTAVLYALNPDGTLRWSATQSGIPGESIGAPAVDAEGRIFSVVASAAEARGVVTIYTTDGALLSSADVTELDAFGEGDLSGDRRGGAAQTPLLDDQSRLFVRMEGTLVGFTLPEVLNEASPPELLWRTAIGARCLNIGPDGSLYAATGSQILRIDPASGEVLNGPRSVSANQEGCPAIDPEGNVYLSNGSNVERWSPDLATRAWVYEGIPGSSEPPGSSPTLAPDGSALYFMSQPDGSSTVRLIALEAGTGDVLWEVPGASQFFETTAPSVRSDGAIYFSASGEVDAIVGPEGRLYGVQPDGTVFFTRAFTTETDDAPVIIGPSVFSSTGTAYLTTTGGFSSFIATHLRAVPLPQVALSDEAIDFGATEVGDPVERTLTVQNEGSETVAIEDLALSGSDELFELALDTVELPPGASANLTVTFTPLEPGVIESVLTISTSAGALDATLTGEGVVTSLALAPTSVDFGPVETGTSASAIVEVTNDGTVAVGIEDILVAGDSDGVFAVGAFPSELGPEEAVALEVTFTPDVPGVAEATLTVFSSAGTDEAPLTGEGVVTAVVLDPEAVAFGSVEVGAAAEQVVTLTNEGSTGVAVEDVLLGGDTGAFTVAFSPVDLLPGDVLSLPVTFAPEEAGAVTATLTVATSAGDEVATLTGEGRVSIVLAEVAFGAVTVGTEEQAFVTLSNTGDTPILLSEATLSGDAGVFRVALDDGVEVAPGEDGLLVITFAPGAEGAFEALLSVPASFGSVEVPLSGTGAPAVTFTVDDIQVTAGQEATVVVTVEGLTPVDAQVLFRPGGSEDTQTLPMTVSGQQLTATLPATVISSRGLDYAVSASDGERTARFPDTPGTFMHRPARLTSVTAGGSFAPGTYRMLSLPLQPADPGVSSVLAGLGSADAEAWRLLRWDPSQAIYAEHPEASFRFDPGNAFWLISREGTSFDVAEGVSVDAGAPFALTLAPGWNQIGVPFDFPVAWAQVTLDDGSEPALAGVEPPVAFDSTAYIPDVEVLEPWEGYFVFNGASDAVTLAIPPVDAEAALPEQGTPAGAGFGYRLVAADERAGVRDPYTYLWAGMPSVTDLRKAPPIGRQVQAAVVNEHDQLLAREVVPWTGDGARWTVEVARHGAQTLESWQVALQLEPLREPPEGTEVRVLDADTGAELSRGASFSVALQATTPVRRLQVLAGTAAFVNDQAAALQARVQGLVVQPAYPNPSAGPVTIAYDLGETFPVQAVVFDALGRRLGQLLDAVQPAGRHILHWDGRDAGGRLLPSGVYFIRFQAGPHTHTISMTRFR